VFVGAAATSERIYVMRQQHLDYESSPSPREGSRITWWTACSRSERMVFVIACAIWLPIAAWIAVRDYWLLPRTGDVVLMPLNLVSALVAAVMGFVGMARARRRRRAAA
jgi:hypothetical protein